METENKLILRYLRTHPLDAARSLERLSPEEVRAILENVPPGPGAGALAVLQPALAVQCLSAMPVVSASRLVAEMPDNLASALLRRIDIASRNALLAAMPVTGRVRLQRLLSHDEDTVGALMEMDYPHLFQDATVREALQTAREQNVSGEVYIVSRNQQLTGITSFRELVSSPAPATLATLARSPRATLSPNTKYAAAVNHPCWLEIDEVPVTSRDGVLLGVLRHRMLRAWAENSLSPGESGLDTAIGMSELAWSALQGLLETVMTSGAKEVRHG